jgi:glycosyltransferase involved in cell wall biosynthesis
MMIIFYIFLLITLIQITFNGLIFSRLLFIQPKNKKELREVKFISIIVCARNEKTNLRTLVPLLLNQNYPNFEVIIVDDRSTDGSAELLKEWQKKDNRLIIKEISETPAGWNSKKYALTQGIEQARGEAVLLTDADCVPASEDWLALMISQLTDNQAIVLGVSLYQRTKGVLNAFIQYETFYTALQYLSLATWGLPYMGVGRNLLYKKSLFVDNQGFNQNMAVTGGDDDLLVGQIATKKNTTICIEPKAYTISIPKTTWGTWYRQKLRHLSVGKQYKTLPQLTLGVLNLSQILFWLLSIYIILGARNENFYGIFISFFLLRSVIVYGLYYLINQKLQAQIIPYTIPFFDFLFGFYIFTVGLIALSQKHIQWKN